MNIETGIYLLIAIMCWGLGAVFDKLTLRYLDAVSAFYGRALMMILFFVILIATGFSRTLNALKNNPKSVIYLSLSIIVTMLGVFTYLKAMSFEEVSKIVPLSSTYPLVTFIIAVLFLGESFTPAKLIGTLLIISGIYFISK
jgi:transporter family protein